MLLLLLLGCQSAQKWQQVNPGIEARADISNIQIKVSESMSVDEARSRMLSKRTAIKSIFNKKVEPYFGVADRGEYCDLKQLPQEKYEESTIQTRLILHLWATKNEVYGICDPELIHFKSQYALLYCPNKRLYTETKFFYPKEQAWQTDPVIRCASF